MSDEKSIQAFIAVIKNQPQLFRAAESQELKKIAADLPTNLEEIWSIISPWLEAHPTIDAAYKSNFIYISSNLLGPGGSKSQKDPVEAAVDRSLGDQLKNEIIHHQPVNFPNLDPANQPPKTK